ncbi:histidine phosphatase family protein [Paenibacillus rhizophilus]|uniref:Histidine phosphatase family protein n=1 Tax=Paenibacillus rhizophilus TaxID=1850366 RepID=A0A3N9P9E0_9BACL|nr:histidine phosphatase family protein [Paenibacillus rhizophilus]RQW12265.1 histidine phosphatase family protein [Paenibacillus rhizophilus]
MEIMLIRHGKSERSNIPKLTMDEYKNWKDEYDRLGVIESKSKIFVEASRHITRAEYVFTSSLYRSQHSLTLLTPGIKATPNDIFNEVNFKSPNLKGIRLSTRLWTFLTGALWYSGLVKEHETIEQVVERAIAASEILTRASEKGIVALVGHGFINLFIYKELKKRGWKEINKFSSKNWSCTRLELLK